MDKLLSSVTSVVQLVSECKLSVVDAKLLEMNVTTALRLIIPDHSRQFGRNSLRGNRSRTQLISGLAIAMATAYPVVSIDSVRYTSSYSTLPQDLWSGGHTWIPLPVAIPVGLEHGVNGVADSAFSASSHWREGLPTDNLTAAVHARLNGPHEWVSEAVHPSPAPVGVASGALPHSAMSASSAYYVKSNMATWNSVSAIIHTPEELQVGLSNPTSFILILP